MTTFKGAATESLIERGEDNRGPIVRAVRKLYDALRSGKKPHHIFVNFGGYAQREFQGEQRPFQEILVSIHCTGFQAMHVAASLLRKAQREYEEGIASACCEKHKNQMLEKLQAAVKAEAIIAEAVGGLARRANA